MTAAPTPWLLRAADDDGDAPQAPAGVEYHRVLAGPHRRILRGVLALVLLAAGLVLFSAATRAIADVVDAALGNDPLTYTPARHAAAMIGLALLMPWSMLIQRWLYRVPGASLHSVISRFRFAVLGKALLVLGPAWLLVTAATFFLPAEQVPWSQTDLMAMVVITLLLTPLQTTGEEYGFRGLAFRVIGGWARSPRAGLIAGTVATSVAFTLVHGSTDPYIISWYLVLWACMAIMTWRTGGLEITVVLHAVLNTVTFLAAFVIRLDFGAAISDRSAGVGTPANLVPALVAVLITAIVWWSTRRSGPVLTPAPTPASSPAPSPTPVR